MRFPWLGWAMVALCISFIDAAHDNTDNVTCLVTTRGTCVQPGCGQCCHQCPTEQACTSGVPKAGMGCGWENGECKGIQAGDICVALNATCQLPSPRPTGYTTANASDPSACIGTYLTINCTVGCDTAFGYVGSPFLTCSLTSGRFNLSGCNPAVCDKPRPLPSGYRVDTANGGICADGSSAAGCSMKCDDGYIGTATVACNASGEEFSFSGCEANFLCNKPDQFPSDYEIDTDHGGCSDGINASSCAIKCASGRIGEAVVSCTANGGVFDFANCFDVYDLDVMVDGLPEIGEPLKPMDTLANHRPYFVNRNMSIDLGPYMPL